MLQRRRGGKPSQRQHRGPIGVTRGRSDRWQGWPQGRKVRRWVPRKMLPSRMLSFGVTRPPSPPAPPRRARISRSRSGRASSRRCRLSAARQRAEQALLRPSSGLPHPGHDATPGTPTSARAASEGCALGVRHPGAEARAPVELDDELQRALVGTAVGAADAGARGTDARERGPHVGAAGGTSRLRRLTLYARRQTLSVRPALDPPGPRAHDAATQQVATGGVAEQ